MIGYNFGPGVREVERTHERVVFEQPGGVAFAIMVVAVGIIGVVLRPDRFALGWGTACGLLAVYFSTRSIFTADHLKHELTVERKSLLWSRRHIYRALDIDRIDVWDTGKGAGLVLLLKSGRKRQLTRSLSFAYEATHNAAIALNSMLYISGHHRQRS